jgi:putative nucleotidyltransferase with HDIG domain
MLSKFLSRLRRSTGNTKQEEKTESFITRATRDTIRSFVHSQHIAPMPSIARRAFELSLDPNAEAKDFVLLLESDEALAARVMKIANSVFFDRGSSSKTLEESVLTIGLNELRGLLQSTTLSEVFPCRSPLRMSYWEHDVATALIARMLAKKLGTGNSEIAFLAGLMHDIGKLLLLQRLPEVSRDIFNRTRKAGLLSVETEYEVIPFDHTEAGVLVAEKWNFSPQIARVIRSHHASWDSVECKDKTVRLVKASDLIAHALGCGHPPGFSSIRSWAKLQLNDVWEALGVNKEHSDLLLQALQQEVDAGSDLYLGRKNVE